MIDTYAMVTNKVIEALEQGAPPWIAPWSGADSRLPANHLSSRPYRGINILLLGTAASQHGFTENRWLTFRQAATLGGHVRRNERGTAIVFFKWLEQDDEVVVEPGSVKRVVPLLRTFTVFNLDQIEGIDRTPPPAQTWTPAEVVEDLLAKSGASIEFGGNRACYLSDRDVIKLPPPAWFADAGGYYATALHELTHWTGHASRCDRPLGRRFGLEAYAFEELVAEMGAAFLSAYCGLQPRLEHASYIDSWLQALRGDKRLIFTAASQAQKAADFITGYVAPVSEVAEQVAA